MMVTLKRRTKKILIGVAVFFLLYTVSGFLIAPLIIKSVVPKKLKETLNREVSIETVRLNPYALSLTVRGFEVKKLAGDGGLVSFDEFYINLQSISLIRKGPVVKEMRLAGPHIGLERNKDETYNFSDIIKANASPEPPEPEDKESGPLKFSINNISITRGSIDINDRLKGVEHTARDLNVSIPFISNLPKEVEVFIKPFFSANFNGTAFESKGTTKPFADTRETLFGIKLSDINLPYYFAYSPVELGFNLASATADLDLNLSYIQYSDKNPSLSLDGNLKLSDILLNEKGGARLIDLPLLDVEIAPSDLLLLDINIKNVLFDSPVITAEIDRKGELNLLTLAPDMAGGTETEQTSTEKGSDSAFTLDIDRIEVRSGRVNFKDFTTATPFKKTIAPIDITVNSLSTSPYKDAGLVFTFKNKARESVKVDGRFSINPVAADLSIDTQKINLAVLQPYLDDKIKLLVKRGYGGVKGNLKLSAGEGESSVSASFNGGVSLSRFWAVDNTTFDDFFKIKTLQVKKIDFTYSPDKKTSLDIKEVFLSDFYTRLIIATDGNFNVSEIAATDGDPAVEVVTEKAATTEEEADKKTSNRPDIKVAKVTLRNGSVNFSDKLVNAGYSTDLLEINGEISSLSTDADKRADLTLTAKLDKYAPLDISGKVNPLSEEIFIDIKVDFKNFELSTLSPYSAKYIGKNIAKGKLFMELKYFIEERELKSENNILIDQITLGEKVESEDATKLPVGLAISLLKNRSGEIELKLPVSGSLDDPKFSIGPIVLKMVVNLLVKAATSPFALLGAIGGGGDELSYVEFDAGSRLILDERAKKLDNLVTALYDRPALKLEIEGYSDIPADTEEIKRYRFERKVKEEKFKKAVRKNPAITVDEIVFEDTEYEKYLWRAYKKSTFDKEKTKVGLTKKLEPEEMKRLILANITVTKEELRGLASERAQAVKEHIIGSGKVEEERVFIVYPDSLTPKEKENISKSRVEFRLK